ncbi:Rv3235 family protein [Gordonia sp. CPCC 205515]
METHRVLIRPAPPYEPPPVASSAPPPAPDTTSAPPPPQRGRAPSATTLEARQFAIATISLVLEVIDRRRNMSQLDGRVALPLQEQLIALTRAMSGRTGAESAATVRRVHVQMCGPGAAEIFGNYRRNGRVRAFAGRIEQMPCRVRAATGSTRSALPRTVEYRWQLVELTMV